VNLISLEHWSPRPDLTQTNPSFAGNGFAGLERKRSMLPDYLPRTYFYTSSQAREARIINGAPYRYTATIPQSRLYDLETDPLNNRTAINDATQLENAIAAFYDGYTVNGIAALFVPCYVIPDFTAAQVADLRAKAHKENGGSSFSQTGQNLSGQAGFAVSVSKDTERILAHSPTRQDILDYQQAMNVRGILTQYPNAFVGTWENGGKHYLDVSICVASKQEALALGKAYQQEAVFDLALGETVSVFFGDAWLKCLNS